MQDYAQKKVPSTSYKVGDIISNIPVQLKKEGIITFSTDELKNSEKQGWKYTEDLHSRNTTTLFFQIKADSTDIILDSDKNRYFKTYIRFGFKDDGTGYQLPGSFYIQEFQSKIGDFGDEGMSYLKPCLLYSGGEFYIFVPNFIGTDQQESSIFIYSQSKGLSKQVLWKNSIRESYIMPYFKSDDKQGFALWQNYNSSDKYGSYHHNVFSTKIEDNKWITRLEEIDASLGPLKDVYHYQVQPFFLPLKIVPFKKVVINSKTYKPFCDLSLFLNTKKDKDLYTRLSNLPIAEDVSKIEKKDYNKYKNILYFNTDSLNSTRVFYEEIPHSTFLIQNVPETKDQDPFPSCESYAYGALYSQWINSDWQLKAMRDIDPNALKKETDISYFGMQIYIRGNKPGISPDNLWRYNKTLQKTMVDIQGGKELDFDFESRKGTDRYFPFEILLQNDNNLDEIPFNVSKYYFNKYGTYYPVIDGKNVEVGDVFRDYLMRLYEDNHSNIKANSNYKSEITELSSITGIPHHNIDMRYALSKPTFQSFLYQIFFKSCSEYVPLSYRNNIDAFNAPDKSEMKQEIARYIMNGKPVLINILPFPNSSNIGHKIMITGYKKIKNPFTGEISDAFKVLNSWGVEWDELTNGGWFLADNIVSYTSHNSIIAILTGDKAFKEEWIENTDDYQRIYKGKYTKKILNYKDKYIGALKSNNKLDASSLLAIMKNKELKFQDFSKLIIPHFQNLGYKLKSVNDKDEEIKFENLEVWFTVNINYRQIVFPTKDLLNQFKWKFDFSKINGAFKENAHPQEGYKFMIRNEND